MKALALILCASVSVAADVGELVRVQDGVIWPSNAVANIESVAQTAAQVQAALAEASAVEAAAGLVSNELAQIRELEAARNATGYIRGFVESFSPGIEHNTNMAASIVRFMPAGVVGGTAYYDIWTYFTEDPGVWPVVRTSDSLGRSNVWNEIDSSDVTLGEVEANGQVYQAYRNRVALPAATTQAYFRVFADVTGAGTNQTFFPVRNGIAVNGATPLTATLTSGTNVMQWIGGVRVQ